MALDKKLLDLLVCPDNRSAVQMASPDLINKVNNLITSGQLKNRAGKLISNTLEAGLIRADGKVLYPVRDDIPLMLVDEGIEISI